MVRGSDRKKRSRNVMVALVVVLAIVALVGSWLAFGRSKQSPAAQFDTATVSRGSQTQTVSLSGTIAPASQAHVTFKVPGTITSVDVKVGAKIDAGQPLAAVGTRDLTNAVTLAKAQLAAARAQLTTAREAKASSAQIDAAWAQVQAMQASLETAENRLSDATLRAPITGTVARVGYALGDEVAGGSSAISGTSVGGMLPGIDLGGVGAAVPSGGVGIIIVATDSWLLDATVGTADLPLLESGQQAVVTPTGTSRTFGAKVETVGIVADQQSGASATFPVTLLISGATDALYSGSSADAVVITGTFPDVLTVPTAAIAVTNGKAVVQKVTAAGTQSAEVTLGRTFGQITEVLSGVAVGDTVQVPKGLVITPPPRPRFGPDGTLISPSASPSR